MRGVARKLGVDEIGNLISLVFHDSKVIKKSRNWYTISTSEGELQIFSSQTSPSSHGKAKWYYEFFHTISGKTFDKILRSQSKILLVEYVNKRYAVLGSQDVEWLIEYSSRNKKGSGETIDIVVKEKNGDFILVPMMTGSGKSRNIEVIGFQ